MKCWRIRAWTALAGDGGTARLYYLVDGKRRDRYESEQLEIVQWFQKPGMSSRLD
jgi:hypothetical protein